MSRAYTMTTCDVCGKVLSTAGVAKYNHMMKHVREGKLVRTLVRYGNDYRTDHWRFDRVKA